MMVADRNKAVPKDWVQKIRDYCLGPNGFWAFLFLLFVGQLMGSAVDSPLVRLPVLIFFTLFFLSAIQNLFSSPLARVMTGLLAIAAILLRWAGHITPVSIVNLWGLALSLLVMVLFLIVSVDRVFRDDRPVTTSRVLGAVAVYVLSGITWAYLYGFLNLLIPDAFAFPVPVGMGDPDQLGTLTYFSFVTLTTLGYGDITPVHPVVRLFVVIQGLFGQLYPATLLARLVSLEITSRKTPRIPEGDEP